MIRSSIYRESSGLLHLHIPNNGESFNEKLMKPQLTSDMNEIQGIYGDSFEHKKSMWYFLHVCKIMLLSPWLSSF